MRYTSLLWRRTSVLLDMRSRLVPFVVLLLLSPPATPKADLLQSAGAIPAHIAGRFRGAAAPTVLFFGTNGRLQPTPGLCEFDAGTM